MSTPLAELDAVEVDYPRGPALGPFSLSVASTAVVSDPKDQRTLRRDQIDGIDRRLARRAWVTRSFWR